MNWHIARDGTQLGTFNEQQVRDGLANGTLLPTDLAWKEGMGDWEPVSSAVKPDAAAGPPGLPPSVMPHRTFAPQPVIQEGSAPGTATASLVCGILGLFLSCLAGIPAIVLGCIALGKIGKSNGALGGRGRAIAGIVLGAIFTLLMPIVASLVIPVFNVVSEKARIMQASSNARQIIITLKNYAGDNGGNYPDADHRNPPLTSNDAFRELFKRGLLEDERAFTAAFSPYEGDNNIGEPPDYKEALKPGENHWCMTKGLSDSSSGNAPLIFEAPSQPGVWPPVWNADAAEKKVPGRAWKGGRIVIGRNDGSVAPERLESLGGTAVPLKKNPLGKDLFTQFPDLHEYLDIAR